ncbi:RICIN domain-containing protein [Micromonospora sp. NPDC047557]|uniref:RICIN domain-containing protein n=1 Tax=Micromonospora sp. NPDC047557 TaxID=3364250 RepID=UPI00371C7590
MCSFAVGGSEQWDWLGAANQQWRLAWAGFGAFALHGRHSDKVLEVSDRSTADGVPVPQWSDLSLANQRRRVIAGT